MSARSIAAVILGCFALGFATGFFARPAKVVTRTEVQEKIVTVTETAKQADVVTVKREIQRPDGTKIVRVVTRDRSVTQTDSRTDAATARTETKTVERGAPQWTLRAMAAFNTRSPSYGAGIERRILGPLFIGAFALSNGTAGVSLSLSF